MRATLFSLLLVSSLLARPAATTGLRPGARGVAQSVEPAAVRCDVQAFVVDPDPAGLNVRRGPDKTSAVIATLKPGDYSIGVTIKGATAQWVRIEEAAAEETGDSLLKGPGWVYGPLLATQARGPYGRNPDRPVVKVFKEADKRSAVVTVLPVETQVNIIGCRGGWAEVRYKKLEGWLPPESQCADTLTTCG